MVVSARSVWATRTGRIAINTSAIKLRLGPLRKTETVKVTFNCTTALRTDLDRYAALHTQTYGSRSKPPR